MMPGANASSRHRETGRAAARCIGAQYVASLDASVAGLLSDTPKVGTSMLFARTDENGRISLVRTGQVIRFERHVEEDPFIERERPSVVATSAPPLSLSVAPTPRRAAILPPPDPYDDGERVDDRTKPVHALRQSDIRELRPPMSEPPTMRNPTFNPTFNVGASPRHPTPTRALEDSGPPLGPPRRSDVAPRPGMIPHRPPIRRRG